MNDREMFEMLCFSFFLHILMSSFMWMSYLQRLNRRFQEADQRCHELQTLKFSYQEQLQRDLLEYVSFFFFTSLSYSYPDDAHLKNFILVESNL